MLSSEFEPTKSTISKCSPKYCFGRYYLFSQHASQAGASWFFGAGASWFFGAGASWFFGHGLAPLTPAPLPPPHSSRYSSMLAQAGGEGEDVCSPVQVETTLPLSPRRIRRAIVQCSHRRGERGRLTPSHPRRHHHAPVYRPHSYPRHLATRSDAVLDVRRAPVLPTCGSRLETRCCYLRVLCPGAASSVFWRCLRPG